MNWQSLKSNELSPELTENSRSSIDELFARLKPSLPAYKLKDDRQGRTGVSTLMEYAKLSRIAVP